VAASSSKTDEDLDAEQRHLIAAVADPVLIRAWLVKRIAERALEIIAAEEKTGELIQKN
jgi:hypothetical protein